MPAMPDSLLILYPADSAAAPPSAAVLRDTLRRIALIGRDFTFRGDTHYLAGDEFMHLVTFLGCSPHIALEPPADGSERDGADFCHIALPAPGARPRFLGGANVKPPRCRGCRGELPEWSAALMAWEQDPDKARGTCPACGRPYTLPQLNWRHSAGFGRVALEVWGVFEGEAVPSQELLSALQGLGVGEWDYFYARRDAESARTPPFITQKNPRRGRGDVRE